MKAASNQRLRTAQEVNLSGLFENGYISLDIFRQSAGFVATSPLRLLTWTAEGHRTRTTTQGTRSDTLTQTQGAGYFPERVRHTGKIPAQVTEQNAGDRYQATGSRYSRQSAEDPQNRTRRQQDNPHRIIKATRAHKIRHTFCGGDPALPDTIPADRKPQGIHPGYEGGEDGSRTRTSTRQKAKAKTANAQGEGSEPAGEPKRPRPGLKHSGERPAPSVSHTQTPRRIA